ncbi:uncharacterized protein LOC128951845 [Oppia nitens]|uniref:uncharacterized protein LOC128951845 n=1 Tax=Oppia nitens TaxID=1686743 RepID=UPI0023D9E4DA|nr:uncharacterized protein LOC128951845 [Oppia nitens]
MSDPLPELPKAVSKLGFALTKKVGEGAFSQVYSATWTDKPNKTIAAKVVDFSKVNKLWIEKNLNNELKILQSLKHTNIIVVHKVVKTTSKAYIFMDFARGGSIADELEKVKQPLSESKVKKYLRDIIAGLTYMHNNGVAHRDIKPDNFLIGDNDRVMLSDFGFACFSLNESNGKLMRGTKCGTTEYQAIEIKILGQGQVYDAKCADLYSLGVSLYFMVLFAFPFDISNESECIRRQKSREFYLKNSKLSDTLKTLIYDLLDPNPKTRITAKKAETHAWLSTNN